MRRPIVVGIAGGSGAGKSYITRNLVARLGRDEVGVLEHDAYYRHLPHLSLEQRAAVNYDHPESFETEMLIEHLDQIVAGRSVEKPRYDFTLHLRLDDPVTVTARPVMLLEGLLVLAEPELRGRCDLKIYVDTEEDLRLVRRLRRDVAERGRTHSSVLDQYRATVRPMHLRFIEPSKQFADVVVSGGDGSSAVGTVIETLQERLRSR